MKTLMSYILVSLFLIISPGVANAHGGGLDRQGGHNCRVGSCAGTYHCHQPRSEFCRQQLGISNNKSNKKKW